MNKREAEKQGLNFTGIYSFSKEEVKERIAKVRKDKPKARIVMIWEPSSKLSRGSHSGGWSAYADEKYRAYEQIENAQKIIGTHESSLVSLRIEYEKQVEDEEKKFKSAQQKLKEVLDLLDQ